MKAWLKQLHTGAQWYGISPARRTPLQRLAARTLGVITPGNFTTLLGLAMTLYGLQVIFGQGQQWGVFLIGAGRLLDIFDGHIARLTQTSSPFGEGLDAASDKVAIIITTFVLIKNMAGAVLLPMAAILIVLLIEEIVTASVTLQARRHGVSFHPTRLGKYTTFALWTSIVAYLVADAFINWENAAWYLLLILLASIVALVALVLRWWNLFRIHAMVHRELKARRTGR
jgi:phosphatidylglycerophosphate synthase